MSTDNGDRNQSGERKILLYAVAAAILLGSIVISVMYL
jgi:hypothetical protein